MVWLDIDNGYMCTKFENDWTSSFRGEGRTTFFSDKKQTNKQMKSLTERRFVEITIHCCQMSKSMSELAISNINGLCYISLLVPNAL